MESLSASASSRASFLPPADVRAAQKTHYYPELDALRGLAAFVVILAHFIRLWDRQALTPLGRLLLEQVFFPFFNGNSSVVLFFLLSGFVLTLPYKRGRQSSYSIFVKRRIARIYLPYLAAFVLALVADWRLHEHIQVSSWFSQTWSAPIGQSLILQHLFLIGNYDTAQVNTAFWSLAVEMRLSLLFPLLCIPLLRWTRSSAITLATCFMLLSVGFLVLSSNKLDTVTRTNISETLNGALAFTAGIFLARWLQPIQRMWEHFSIRLRIILFLSSCILWEWSGNLNHHLWMFVNVLTIAGASGVLIAALRSRRAGRFLRHAFCAWLGRISYSLYLVHGTVLFALVHLFFGPLSRQQLLLPYLLLTFFTASAFFFIVEEPAIRLSASIGRKAVAI